MKIPHIDKSTSFAVLGLGKFGMKIASELSENGYQVLCCDKDSTLVGEMAEIATEAVQADITESAVLAGLGIGNYDVVIVSFSDNFEAELITTMIVKEMGVPFVVAKANGVRQKKILEGVGADKVIMPEIEMGHWAAQKFMNNDLLEYINNSESYEVMEVSPKREWIGKSLAVLDLRKHNQLNILALIRDNQVVPNLSPEEVILKDDRIVALHTIQR